MKWHEAHKVDETVRAMKATIEANHERLQAIVDSLRKRKESLAPADVVEILEDAIHGALTTGRLEIKVEALKEQLAKVDADELSDRAFIVTQYCLKEEKQGLQEKDFVGKAAREVFVSHSGKKFKVTMRQVRLLRKLAGDTGQSGQQNRRKRTLPPLEL